MESWYYMGSFDSSKENKISIVFFIIILIVLNIMRVITFPNVISFNVAVADLFFIPAILLLFISLHKYQFKDVFESYWLFALLLMWIILSNSLAFYSVSITNSGMTGFIGELIKTSICIGYFFIGVNILRYIKPVHFIRVWTLGALIFFTYGFFASFCVSNGYLEGLIDLKYKLFFLGTYTDPNHAATFIIINIYIMLLALKVDKNKVARVTYISLLILSPISLMLTDSRGGVIGFIISVFTLLILYIRKNKKLMITGGLILAIGTLLAFIVDSILSDGYITRRVIMSIANFSSGLQTRFDLAKAAYHMGNDHFIFGVGRGNYIMNSVRYLDEVKEKLIPHNTYLGLYAEVGIIGTILYFTPILLIMKYTYKAFKDSKEWLISNVFFYKLLIAASIGISIQAAVLNMENRRTLWFLAGVVIYIIKNKSFQVEDLNFTSQKYKLDKVNIVLLLLLLATYIFGAFNVSYEMIRTVEQGDCTFQIPISQEDIGKEFTLDYNIYARQKDFQGEALEVSILERSDKGTENIISQRTYSLINGNAKMPFVKQEEDSKLYFQVDKLSSELEKYYILPIRIYNEEKSISLNRNYFFAPIFMKDLVVLNTAKPYVDGIQYQHFLGENIPINFDDKIILEDVQVDEINHKKIIEFTYQCKENLEDDYVLWMYGIPDNIHNLDEKRWWVGNEYYVPTENVLTSEWIPGKSYTVSYEFPRNIGWYELHCGFYKKVDDEVVRLYLEGENTYSADLGWFNAAE